MSDRNRPSESRHTPGDPGRVPPDPRYRLVAYGLSIVFSLVFAEVFLRAFLPPQTFLDYQDDGYWLTRLQAAHPSPEATDADWEHHPQLGWRMKPSLREEQRSHNSRGLRGSREYPIPSTGVRRIAVIGDSIAYGLGLPDQDTFPALLEGLLPAEYEVLNFGVNGYGSDQAYLTWQLEATRYAPEIVILGYPVDDFHRNVNLIRDLPKPRFVVESDRLRLTGVPVPTIEELLESEGTAPALRGPRLLVALRWASRKLMRTLGNDPAAEAFEEKVTLNRLVLRDLARSVDEHGAELIVVIFPHCAYSGYPDLERIENAISDACDALGIPWVNVRERLQESDAAMDQGLAYLDNCHLSAVGTQITAELTAEVLRRRGALKPAPNSGASEPRRP